MRERCMGMTPTFMMAVCIICLVLLFAIGVWPVIVTKVGASLSLAIFAILLGVSLLCPSAMVRWMSLESDKKEGGLFSLLPLFMALFPCGFLVVVLLTRRALESMSIPSILINTAIAIAVVLSALSIVVVGLLHVDRVNKDETEKKRYKAEEDALLAEYEEME